MVPVKKPQPIYNTLEEIRLRKDELQDQMQTDSKEFSKLWGEIFIKREGNSRGDYIAGLVANSVALIDLFLLVRKLKKNYGGVIQLFHKKKKR